MEPILENRMSRTAAPGETRCKGERLLPGEQQEEAQAVSTLSMAAQPRATRPGPRHDVTMSCLGGVG